MPDPAREGEHLLELGQRLGVAIPLESEVGEVGVARRDEREPVRERSVDRVLGEDPGLFRPTWREEHALGRPAAREHLRELQRLGDVESLLGPLGGQLDVAREPVRLSQPDQQQGEVGVRLVAGDCCGSTLHQLDRLLEPALVCSAKPSQLVTRAAACVSPTDS